MNRKGAKRISEIPADILEKLNKGEIETANLVECLAINFESLLKNCFPKISPKSLKEFTSNKKLGWLEKCRISAKILVNEFGDEIFHQAKNHKSDMIRTISCAILEANTNYNLKNKLHEITPLANDHHVGVREGAWLFLRKDISENIYESIELLSNFVSNKSENLRRFASEVTRPRGVWCKHIEILKNNPEIALPILNPLKNEICRYPANSVANWLNDASKTKPDFVIQLTEEWKKLSPTKETNYICKRASRTLNSNKKN